jgi:hypothetical protein
LFDLQSQNDPARARRRQRWSDRWRVADDGCENPHIEICVVDGLCKPLRRQSIENLIGCSHPLLNNSIDFWRERKECGELFYSSVFSVNLRELCALSRLVQISACRMRNSAMRGSEQYLQQSRRTLNRDDQFSERGKAFIAFIEFPHANDALALMNCQAAIKIFG